MSLLDDIQQRERADDISNLWQISIHNISSLFRKEHKRTSNHIQIVLNCKKRDEAKRMLQLLEMQADWLSNRNLCTKNRKKESTSFLNALLIYLPPQTFNGERLYGIETLQNKAIRYLFNLIHNSSSTPSPYNVRETNKDETLSLRFS